MTVPACLRLADEVFPRVRALAARRLVAQGWSQQRAGEAVGLSQAMVSRHLAAAAPDDPVAQRLADDLVAVILQPAAAEPAHGPSAWCATLSIGHERAGGDEALRDLLAAENRLREANPLQIMPQVGLNLARAVPSAAGPADILAFPGRLVEAGGRILSPRPSGFRRIRPPGPRPARSAQRAARPARVGQRAWRAGRARRRQGPRLARGRRQARARA